MKSDCVSIEDLAALRHAPADDPRRRHVDGCARCAALQTEYAAFIGAEPADGADTASANERLAAFIAEHIERAPGRERTVHARRPSRGWFSLSPRRSITMAAAAALLLIAVSQLRDRLTTPPMVLRGDADANQLATYSVAGDGSVPLVWAPVEGADAYRITILGEDLVELTRIGPVAGNTFPFRPADYDLRPGRYFWEVTALAGGDSVGSAGPAPLFVR